MADYTWTFDVSDNVLKNHAMSSRLRETSIAKTIMQLHTTPEGGFGKGRGESVTITRFNAIAEPNSGTLTENNPIPEDQFAINTQKIVVKEFGRSVPFTSLSQDLTNFNVQNQIQKELMKQMRLTTDTTAGVAFKEGQVYYVPSTLSTNTITTNGSAGGAAASNMNVFHAGAIRDFMIDTLFIDPDTNGEYTGIFRTKGLRGIKDDAEFEEWHKYTTPDVKRNSEVGKVEQIRFQETNHANVFAEVGTNSVLGEGVVFGSDAVSFVEAQSPELRVAMAQDFGRKKAVAWYGIMAWGQIYSDSGSAGQARVVRVSST